MKQLYFLFILLITASISWGQTAIQNFSTSTGTHTSQTGSTSFLPAPTVGTTWARAGATSPSAPINLETASNPFGTTGAFVRAVASSSASVTKFSPIIDYTASKEFYTSFKVLLGDNSGSTTATTGWWYFFIGDGVMYSDSSNYNSAQVFSCISFGFPVTNTGKIALNYRLGGSWSTTGLIQTEFDQGVVYNVQIVGNNTTNPINYNYDGIGGSVDPNKFDLYINVILIGNDLGKSSLPADANIDSITFIGLNSTSNSANIFVDNVEVYNSIPSNVLNVVKNNITGFSLYPNPVKGGKVFINSANNYAERSIAIFDVLGKQVVSQKGTQNTVDVSHLNKGIYIMKVEEEGKIATSKLVIE